MLNISRNTVNRRVNKIVNCVFSVFNNIFRMRDNNIMFIPHENCITDNYDILNSHSDNALCLFKYVLSNDFYKNYTLYLLINRNDKISEYNKYCNRITKGAKFVFIYRDFDSLKYLKSFATCSTIFVDHMNMTFPKKKSQKVICLGYFTPFKNDFIWPIDVFKKHSRINNNFYTYSISTSDLSSRILSSDTGLYYNRFIPLGMSRNDLFYNYSNDDLNVKAVSKEFDKFDKIILYTPTFRDYELSNQNPNRTIFGYNEDLDALQNILEQFNAVIVVKLHPLQNHLCIKRINSKNIVVYNTNQECYSLYDLLCLADILITDYTSTYFDYLHLNRPVIFNFYDKETYQKFRGFAVEQIEEFCAGPIVNNYNGLIKEIRHVLEGMDAYEESRTRINNLFNKYKDGKASERICKFLWNIN